MLIFSKGDGYGRVIGIPAIGAEDDTSTYSKQTIVCVSEGWNEIPQDLWPKCVLHIKDKLDNEELITYTKKDENGEQKQCGLEEVRADKAREIVKGCFNIKNLKEWAENTKLTSELRAQVDIQLAACEKGEDPNKKK